MTETDLPDARQQPAETAGRPLRRLPVLEPGKAARSRRSRARLLATDALEALTWWRRRHPGR